METVFYILAKSVRIALDLISISMMVRAFMPLLVDVEENGLYMMTLVITEPIVAPVRYIMGRFGIGTNTPIDMGFLATYLILIVIDLFLPII